MEWISVKDRLPEIHEDVLIWFRGTVCFGDRTSDGHWRPEGGNGNFDDDITHWMPLPDPPKPAGTKRWKCEGCGAKWASDTPPFNGNHLIMIEHPGPECGPVVEDAETPK